MRPRLSVAVAAFVSALSTLASCGQPPSAGGPVGEGAADDLEEVYAELQGLEGDEYMQRLEELAAEEDADLTWYTSMNLEDSKPVTDGFNEAYPEIDVEIYRASSSDVMQRLLQESSAGYEGADLVAVNGPEMQILGGKDLTLPLNSPTRADISAAARFPTWLGIYLNAFSAGWNTDAIGEGETPTSWDDVFHDYSGRLAMELGDWDWFATLVQDYFMKQKGMSEAEAVQLFREAASGATFIDGHTTMAELLAAGEFDIVASAYQYRLIRLGEEGAPVEWEPAVEPVVVRANGIGIYRDTDAPATALLFIEYALNEGQQTIADASRMPANVNYGHFPELMQTLTVDFDEMNAERAKWEKLYEQIVKESDEKVIEGN